MSLMLPYPGGGLTQHNLAATPSASAPGTTVTAHATINTKGSWVELITATTFPVFGVTLMISSDGTAATQVANLYDLGVGAAASEVVLISNLLNTSPPTGAGMKPYFFPIYIPKGARIAARKQSNITVKTGSVVIFCHGGFSAPPWRTFAGADAIGADTADSGGFTHTTGNSGTYSTWTNIGSTLARQYGALMPIVSSGTDTTMGNNPSYLQVGIASTVLATRMFTIDNSVESISTIVPNIPIYGNFATGTQMMIRGTSNTTADTDLEFAIMGLY
jgi:hypothetical protein